jgi:hypothetical protein
VVAVRARIIASPGADVAFMMQFRFRFTAEVLSSSSIVEVDLNS